MKKILNFFDNRLIIAFANKFFLNKQRIIKESAINEVLNEIENYFNRHSIKKYIIGEEAKILQKIYFKNRSGEKYEKLLQKLNNLKSIDEVINFLSKYYLEDISADFNPAFLIFFKYVCKIKFRQFIKNLKVVADRKDIEKIKKIQGNFPLFYLPNHVSNADHIPIAFVLNRLKLFHPVIVAGANLYRGISKILLPKLNVEKLRRDYLKENFKWIHNPLYRMAFKYYNFYLWEKNEPFLFYIEGGRSRDGKIGKPKLGIITDIFEFIKSKNRKAYFTPITISYTVVPEDTSLFEAQNGKNITDRDLFQELSYLNYEYKNFKNAEIFVKILSPIEVSPDNSLSPKEFAHNIIEILRKNIVPTSTYLLANFLMKNRDVKIEDINDENMKKALEIFIKRGFLKVEEGLIKIIHKDLIEQYSNRLAFKDSSK